MPLTTFFLLTFVVSWIGFYTGAALWSQGPISGALGVVIFNVGIVAPGLLGLTLTWRAGGAAAVRALLAKNFGTPVKARWYVFALSWVLAIKLLAALIHRLVAGGWPRFGDTPWFVMAAAILFSMWVQAGEELGWRAFALPRLSSRLGLGTASLVLGVIWAAWHLPLFFIDGADTKGQSFVLYLLQVTAMSVTMAWLYWRTNASLLPVMTLHAAANNTKDIVPSAVAGADDVWALAASPVGWLTVALLWTCAIGFLADMRRVRDL